MTIFQALILGLIQGFTEFLPISSSGHLIFLPRLFGWQDQGLAFDVVVHLGTLLAVVWYFRRRLWQLFQNFFHSEATSERRLGWMVLVSVLPAMAVGFFFGDWIEEHTRSSVVVAWSLMGWAVVLGAADAFHRGLADHQATKPLQQLTWKNVIWIACAQAVALIPGTSRSGITMTAGLFVRLDKTSAAEFSFLMSVPVIAIAGAAKLFEVVRSGGFDLSVYTWIVGFLAAAVSGWIAIAALMKIIRRWSFMPFVVYRILIGILILFYL